jgi:preprotein translocase subunit SecE
MSLSSYFKGVQTEIKHVVWPTRRQALVLTGVVIVLSLLVAAYLGVLDVIFTRVLETILI